MTCYDFLRPDGSPCPECGAPVERRRSAADPASVLMRCSRCGWSGRWRKPGAVPAGGTIAQQCEDYNWLTEGQRRAFDRSRPARCAEVLEFRPRA